MKKFSKIVAVAAATVMAAGMLAGCAGCGGGGSAEGGSSDNGSAYLEGIREKDLVKAGEACRSIYETDLHALQLKEEYNL